MKVRQGDRYKTIALSKPTLVKRAILILTLFSLTLSYGQESNSDQSIEFTEETIKNLFILYPEWSYCSVSDSSYYSADTIMLYSDNYYYLSTKCCYETSWHITKSTTLDMSVTNVCQEPPPSLIDFEKRELELRFDQIDNFLILSIYKNHIKKDQFNFISLDYIELKKDQFTYRLTLVR